MIIKIKASAVIKEEKNLTINPNTNITVLLKLLCVDEDKVGIIIVNGARVMADYILKENDSVKIISPITGG